MEIKELNAHSLDSILKYNLNVTSSHPFVGNPEKEEK